MTDRRELVRVAKLLPESDQMVSVLRRVFQRYFSGAFDAVHPEGLFREVVSGEADWEGVFVRWFSNSLGNVYPERSSSFGLHQQLFRDRRANLCLIDSHDSHTQIQRAFLSLLVGVFAFQHSGLDEILRSEDLTSLREDKDRKYFDIVPSVGMSSHPWREHFVRESKTALFVRSNPSNATRWLRRRIRELPPSVRVKFVADEYEEMRRALHQDLRPENVVLLDDSVLIDHSILGDVRATSLMNDTDESDEIVVEMSQRVEADIHGLRGMSERIGEMTTQLSQISTAQNIFSEMLSAADHLRDTSRTLERLTTKVTALTHRVNRAIGEN